MVPCPQTTACCASCLLPCASHEVAKAELSSRQPLQALPFASCPQPQQEPCRLPRCWRRFLHRPVHGPPASCLEVLQKLQQRLLLELPQQWSSQLEAACLRGGAFCRRLANAQVCFNLLCKETTQTTQLCKETMETTQTLSQLMRKQLTHIEPGFAMGWRANVGFGREA